MSINKVMVSVFCMVISATLSAMELEKSQEKSLEKSLDVKRTRPKDIVNRSVESSSPSFSFSFSLPTVSTVINSASSLVNTLNNYWYDEEAFKKLGWPITDITAQQELENTLVVYQRVNKYFQTREKYDDLLEDHKVIERRYGYCRRVLDKLPEIPKRSEALALATFCLNTHGQAMNDFLKTDFLLFVSEETGKSIQEVEKATLELAQLKIIPDNNPLLKTLFEQTAREKQRKEEEEKKRKEEEDKKRELEEEEKKRLEQEEEKKRLEQEEEKKRLAEEKRRKKEEQKEENKKNNGKK